MDIAFDKEIHDFLVVYLDDLTPFSKSDQEHLKQLRKLFMTCRKYDISLNPKKSLFALEEGKLLGHIISKDGIRIDPERIQAILQIPYPRNIKELQAFLGKINFLRRFIQNLAELIRLLRNMLKKDAKVKWSLEAKQAFESIKPTLTQTPVLTSPQFDRDFIIFSFASEHTIAVILLQKDDQGNEKPIAFFSRALRDAPLKYQIMEKQAYALVKAIKYFRIYILYSHVIAYVPNAVVKDILTQEGLEGKRGKWIASILEYDIEIKPTKLIKGQGLAKLMSETNFQALDINQLDDKPELATPQISETFMQSPCTQEKAGSALHLNNSTSEGKCCYQSKGSNQSNNQEEDVQNRAITEETRQFDLLFLASHKEKPSPSGATVSLLLQQEIGRFGESLGNRLIPWPVLRRKSPKLPDFAKLIRFKDRKGPETKIKEYQIKSTGKKHVKEYQQAVYTINVAAKSISEDLNGGPKQEKI
eukprot:PITA_06226